MPAHICGSSLSLFGRNFSISVRKCDPSWQKVMLKVNLASQSLFLSQFHDLSSMRADSKYPTWTWSQLLSLKPPSGGQYDSFEQYFWQIFALVLAWGIRRMCFANLEMRHSFMDLLNMVWCLLLFHMILQCNMIFGKDFSFKMTHPLFKIPKENAWCPPWC